MSEPISQVHPQLWIANITAARTSDMSQFDAVVTVCKDSIEDHIPDRIAYYSFNMSDGATGREYGRSDYEYFEYAARTILRHLQDGDAVLTHCHAGQSRSSSTSIAALAVLEDTDYHEMYSRVEEARPQIHPDSQLEQHAQRFIEERLDGVSHAPFDEHRID